MRALKIKLTALLFSALLFTGAPTHDAQAYEEELQSLAAQLVEKLDQSAQRSATVLDLTDLQGASTLLGRFISQDLSDQLFSKAKRISFVDRANVQQLLRENKLTEDGLIDPKSSQKLGQLIGIDTIVLGTVTPIGRRSLKVSVRAIAVETGKIIIVQSTQFEASEDLMSMYTKGASVQPDGAGNGSKGALDNLREDALRLTGGIVKIDRYHSSSPYGQVALQLSNLSGMPLRFGLVTETALVGECSVFNVTGMHFFYDSEIANKFASEYDFSRLVSVPQNGKIKMLWKFTNNCVLRPGSLVDATATLVIVSDEQVSKYPISIGGLRVDLE